MSKLQSVNISSVELCILYIYQKWTRINMLPHPLSTLSRLLAIMAQRGILLLLVVVVVGDSLGLTRSRQARQASQTEEEELAGGNNRNLAHHHIILSLKGQIVILGQRAVFFYISAHFFLRNLGL